MIMPMTECGMHEEEVEAGWSALCRFIRIKQDDPALS